LDLSSGHNLFLVPIFVCGAMALLVAFDRAFYLFAYAALAPGPFMAQVQRHVLAGELDKALAACASAPKAPLANVVRAALRFADADRDERLLAVEQASLDAVPLVQRRLGWLATFANVATLFGLLGTILGLIQSFQAVSTADPEDKQALLASGIALAMRATAAGLTVAIPSLLLHSWLVQRANALLDDVDRNGLKMVLLLEARRRNPAPAAAVGLPDQAAEVAK
jgi:biopolymer transport protein ExbB/TolQ